jgi:hypothetical protein
VKTLPPERIADVPEDPEPRWPALIAALAATGLYAALPESLAVGPRWLLGAVIVVLALGTILTRHRGLHRLNVLIGHLLSGTLTVFMLWSLGLLVKALPAHKEPPVALLRSAVALWGTNVLVFALWYWRLDAGGPHARDLRAGHETGSFLFPQMTLEGPAALDPDGRPWSPQFVDYLFLAFNTSTAFSPTDVPILGRGAKVLVMIQSMISLSIVAILAARAVNIL